MNSFIVHPSKSSRKVSHNSSSLMSSSWYRVALVVRYLLRVSVAVDRGVLEVGGIRGLPAGF